MERVFLTNKSLASSYLDVKRHVISKGFAWEIDWQYEKNLESLTESEFLKEAAWVILSSGMSVRSVSRVFKNISEAFQNWNSSSDILRNGEKCVKDALVHFNHKGKINAILSIAIKVHEFGFNNFKTHLIQHGIEFIIQFDYFGPATSYHLAKNIGMNVVKPDRHLIRLSKALKFSSPDSMCEVIAKEIDEKISVIDVVLWRYCVLNPNYLKLIERFKSIA